MKESETDNNNIYRIESNQLLSEKIIDKDNNCIVEYTYTLGKSGETLKVEETPSGKTTKYIVDTNGVLS